MAKNETAERNKREAIRKAQEWKILHGADWTARAVWSRYGYVTTVDGDDVVIWGRNRVGIGTHEIARI